MAHVTKLHKALLIMHAPTDAGIDCLRKFRRPGFGVLADHDRSAERPCPLPMYCRLARAPPGDPSSPAMPEAHDTGDNVVRFRENRADSKFLNEGWVMTCRSAHA